MCNNPDCPGGDERLDKFACSKCSRASQIKWIDRRKTVKILRTETVGEMVFTEGEEWLVDKDLEKLLIDHKLI